MTMTTREAVTTRAATIARALEWFDGGHFLDTLARRVAYRTESQRDGSRPDLVAYLEDELAPALTAMGFSWRLVDDGESATPFVIAERIEDPALTTVLSYGHGDVVAGQEGRWGSGRSPWVLAVEGERWYGRGTADNKGQHSVNLAALEQVLAARGRLGFNAKFVIETGEELGSPGLRALCERERGALAANVFIASDGPRLAAAKPTLFLGSRGAFNFDLVVELRSGAHHSGNWGGLLANPATILAGAIASLVDARGRILIDSLRTPPIPASVAAALATIEPGEPGGPTIDRDWGEPDRSPAERVFASNALEVLAIGAGNPERPVNAIPGRASAHLQVRFVPGCEPETFVAALRAHLDVRGFECVAVVPAKSATMRATRLDPAHPWVGRVAASIERTTGAAPAVLPGIGGSLPNDCFADVLGLPTVWIPHSYPGCSQHAPDEHLLAPVAREALAIMAGLWYDLGDSSAA
jgi:acetylornithine deacetylase/succinyl-diaminopimelate desuccinylase-like protein